ncbi:MAG TPA: phospho-sugar mutase [Opitutaceae bacterium]|jgi:phosphoglucomutase|nr:phospho-sugar mutase [Opitutaceae bacterium]
MTTSEKISAAARSGQILPGTAENLAAWLGSGLPAWAVAGIDELVAQSAWSELNDRFYRYLEFGTGGMRGRTIGAVAAQSELGTPGPEGTPEHAAIGSNMLNDFTLIRAIIGLYRYTKKFLGQNLRFDVPRLVIAYDVRHFSRHFCELAASTWTRLGGVAFIFDGPRSTPQLSFSVRWLRVHAGAVITASHNPPHDNGFKAYFEDGGQVVPPHDKGIIAEVNAVQLGELGAFLEKDLARVVILKRPADDAYLVAASRSIIDHRVFPKANLKVIYSNIHGTGSVAATPLLLHARVDVVEVIEQVAFDPRFPTVKSPNPENAEALALAIATAEKRSCDIVFATDPDADRMGAAVRGRDGKMVILTGNQIGALLAEYRITRYKELGWLPAEGTQRAVLIKTFVTTPLQDAIARGHGLKVINTLTGFKWIAARLHRYEEEMMEALRTKEHLALDYDATPARKRAELMQAHSTFFVLGDEESLGYLGTDAIRDKDGNAACLMFAEVCAALKLRGVTVPEYLDELYLKYGYHLEDTINIYYEGASGAEKIKRILGTYREQPPAAFGDVQVARFQDFGREKITDADGATVPAQDLYFVTLANGYSFAARGSGTEPKMKFYLFANERVGAVADLPAAKARVAQTLGALKKLIEQDAKRRAEG